MLISSIISVALLGSLSLLPVQAKMPVPATKHDCCAKSASAEQHKGCGKETPKSPQKEQCCQACFACVAIVTASTLLPKRVESRETYFDLSEIAQSRALRPPVPPPRDALF